MDEKLTQVHMRTSKNLCVYMCKLIFVPFEGGQHFFKKQILYFVLHFRAMVFFSFKERVENNMWVPNSTGIRRKTCKNHKMTEIRDQPSRSQKKTKFY